MRLRHHHHHHPRKRKKKVNGPKEAEREMTYCRIFDTNTLGYSFSLALVFTSRTQSRQPQWHKETDHGNQPGQKGSSVLCLYRKERKKTTLCAYVCVFDGFRARSSTSAPLLFLLSSPFADMKAKQSNQILIGWWSSSNSSAGTKNKKKQEANEREGA